MLNLRRNSGYSIFIFLDTKAPGKAVKDQMVTSVYRTNNPIAVVDVRSVKVKKWLFLRDGNICLFGLFLYFVTLWYNRGEHEEMIKETNGTVT